MGLLVAQEANRSPTPLKSYVAQPSSPTLASRDGVSAQALPSLSKRSQQHRDYIRDLQEKKKQDQQRLVFEAERVQRRRHLLASRILGLSQSNKQADQTACRASFPSKEKLQQSHSCCHQPPHPTSQERDRPLHRAVGALYRSQSLPVPSKQKGGVFEGPCSSQWAREFLRWKRRRGLHPDTHVFCMGGTGRHSGVLWHPLLILEQPGTSWQKFFVLLSLCSCQPITAVK
jgi:hypothetical protein